MVNVERELDRYLSKKTEYALELDGPGVLVKPFTIELLLKNMLVLNRLMQMPASNIDRYIFLFSELNRSESLS